MGNWNISFWCAHTAERERENETRGSLSVRCGFRCWWTACHRPLIKWELNEIQTLDHIRNPLRLLLLSMSPQSVNMMWIFNVAEKELLFLFLHSSRMKSITLRGDWRPRRVEGIVSGGGGGMATVDAARRYVASHWSNVISPFSFAANLCRITFSPSSCAVQRCVLAVLVLCVIVVAGRNSIKLRRSS